MKSCPQCNQSYNDETLNFCLNDGAMLVQTNIQNQQAATVMMNQPRVTANQQPIFVTPPPTFGNNVPPPKKSKTWMWVLGIFAVLGLIGVVGVIGIAALISQIPEENDNNNRNVKRDSTNLLGNKKKTDDSTPTKSNDDNNDDVQKDDLSDWKYSGKFGESAFKGNELLMSSNSDKFSFTLSSPDFDFQTENATTKVTVKNIGGQVTSAGFGLMINCDEETPLKSDYVFLIDSKAKKFRIAKHISGKETNIIDWTSSSSINSGTEYNELEVKEDNGSMTFYVNGQAVKTIKDTENNKSGIVGLYVGTQNPIAFSNLEIRK